MKTVLITGANGLLGQKLVYLLREKEGYTCIATAKGENRLADQQGYTYYPMDITQHGETEQLISAIHPDFIIHTAAMTNVDACETDHEGCRALNTDAVVNLAGICERLHIHLVHLSTDFIFDGEDGPYDEEAPPRPLSFYGHSKWDAEKAVMKMKSPWSIVRTVLVYGIVDNMSRSNIVLWVKNSLRDGKSISVVDDQFRTPTFAEDLAEGCFLIVEHKATGIFNISGPDFMHINELAHRVAAYYQLDSSKILPSKSETLGQPAKRPPVTGFVLDKAKKILGYSPHHFEESLAILESQLNK